MIPPTMLPFLLALASAVLYGVVRLSIRQPRPNIVLSGDTRPSEERVRMASGVDDRIVADIGRSFA